MTERWSKMVEPYDSAVGISSDVVVKLLARQHRAVVKLVESTLNHEISSLDNERSATMRKRYGHTVSVLGRLLAALAKKEGGEEMKQHFVTFLSPGTLFAESTVKPIDSWDVNTAVKIAKDVTERYGAKPYAFQFSTRGRSGDELDSKVTKSSPLYYLGGIVETLNEIASRNDPSESILLSNMRCNGWDRVVTCQTPYRWTQPLKPGDVVLPTAPATKGKSHE